jgi:hypothetical protein
MKDLITEQPKEETVILNLGISGEWTYDRSVLVDIVPIMDADVLAEAATQTAQRITQIETALAQPDVALQLMMPRGAAESLLASLRAGLDVLNGGISG